MRNLLVDTQVSCKKIKSIYKVIYYDYENCKNTPKPICLQNIPTHYAHYLFL